MKPLAAWGAVAAMVAATVAALTVPWPWAVGLAAAGIAAAPRRTPLVALAAGVAATNLVLYGFLVPTGHAVEVGPLVWGSDGARTGLAAAARLSAMAAANVAIASRIGLARLVDGLRLPAPATVTVAAVLLLAADAAQDAKRLVLARSLERGAAPHRAARGLQRLREAAGLLPALLRNGVGRAETRRHAARLAGHDLPAAWAPFVAVTALAVAGRLATLALPNIALTYVVAFAGGLLYGGRVAAAAGALAMALTDLALTGLAPAGLVNIPAMALVGAAGGAMRGVAWEAPGQRAAARVLAGGVGAIATIAFSVVADVTTWLVIPESRATPGALPVLVATGLAFNVLPAAANAVLFAAALPGVAAARGARSLA